MQAAKVYLVGAGPGDPELLTLKAVKALQQADVVLVDSLVHDDVLKHCRADAQIQFVGKRGGCKSTPQADIEALMLAAALRGDTVVRLKGGDPFIFGRGGEELDWLHSHGIEVEVINGVTSALAAAAAAGAALTHRDSAQGVLFLTGHSRAEQVSHTQDWAALGQQAVTQKLTLVVYMGVNAAEHICSGLLQTMPADTTVAVVENASLPEQRVVRCTLATLIATLRQERIHSPALLLMGGSIH